jgi:hypothetical protein
MRARETRSYRSKKTWGLRMRNHWNPITLLLSVRKGGLIYNTSTKITKFEIPMPVKISIIDCSVISKLRCWKAGTSCCIAQVKICSSCLSKRRSVQISAWTPKTPKLHGLSPRANYTDRATAACRRSDCQLVRIEDAMLSARPGPLGYIPLKLRGLSPRAKYTDRATAACQRS